ncbi:MAG: dehydrogenase [ubiquinone] 1 alpha subcomplex assembly factor 7 [Sphingomonadales bacterium]|jgi:SAM-dependent MidA family methyltransferase|nr:dehydrogenase [ubiquinone] 1 alpha subcomplex assembly factor 7 [Sphingomonadales bacterium]
MTLADRLRRLIEAEGPIPVADYVALANAHYYATRDPLGPAGDFVTAPEISQTFGELAGLCVADAWDRAGRPEAAVYVELGPGRGTLAADLLRAMRAAGLAPAVHFVETSPVLRAAQAERVPAAAWHDDLAGLPEDGPLLVVANEFFDALPARQFVRAGFGWCERVVDVEDGRFVPKAGPPVPAAALPAHVREAPEGSILEVSPAADAVIRDLAQRLVAQGGVALIVDYGHALTAAGETLQAVRGHRYADPWTDPGESDLTVHVDFEALAGAAEDEGARVLGPVGQGDWLKALGIDARTEALAARAPERRDGLERARDRLVGEEEMGRLFKVLAVAAPGWPDPAGFA